MKLNLSSENPFPSLTEEMGFFGGLGGLSERLAQAGEGVPQDRSVMRLVPSGPQELDDLASAVPTTLGSEVGQEGHRLTSMEPHGPPAVSGLRRAG